MIKVAAASWLVAQPAVFDLAADEKVVEQTLCEGRRRKEECGCERVRDMGGAILWVTKTKEREEQGDAHIGREERGDASGGQLAACEQCRL